ncbi:MAG: efflux RND transporter periplasmic adaptor subunit [[Clostridium] fimetarium]|nr:efflux RND transporter periplasmic adaptor subunit [Alistipes timonensis]MCM1405503.1 efflux RND transporter periplasmic adaptor subunit [[Clostridium] fimetarium]
MKKVFKIILWSLVGLVFIGTFVYLFYNSRDKKSSYELVTPQVGSVERTTVLTGKIEPRDEIEIKPQISGIISEILVEAGDLVKDGDIIAKIRVIPEQTQLSSAENRVEVARISLEEAKLTFERTKTLYEKKYESRERFEADRAAYERAVKELEQARDQLTIVRDGVSSANAQNSNTLVRSTVTGLVLEVPVKVGSSVIQANTFNDGTTIAKVADMTDLIFKGKVDETEVDLLSEGMSVRISVGAVSGSDYPAVIEKIAPIATEENGTNTFEVKAALDPANAAKLRAGYSANATVILEKAENVTTIPERVIEYSADSAFVYLLKGDEAKEPYEFERRAVKTGVSDGLVVEIKDGGVDKDSRLRGNKKEEK